MLTSAESEGHWAGQNVWAVGVGLGLGLRLGKLATLESIMNLISRAILVLLINAVASVTSAALLGRRRGGKYKGMGGRGRLVG